MWYVIQVQGGQEEKTAEMIQKQVSCDAMEECFIPKKERVKKFRGRWQRVEETIFPGYVFTVTERPEELFLELKNVPRLTKLLQDGVFYFIPISAGEEELIRSIGDNYHVARISRVQVDELQHPRPNQKVTVIDGPLKAQEGRIIKYNLHKREAIVRLPFMGNELELKMGIEILKNTQKISE